MLTKLLQVLFVPRHVRGKMAKHGPASAGPSKVAPGKAARGKAASSAPTGDRNKLLEDTMSLYRQQRQDVYESLDEATRRQIEEDAEKAFGDALRPKG